MSINLLILLLLLSHLVFLFPLKDRRSRRYGFPWMTASLVAVNILIHGGLEFHFSQTLPGHSDEAVWRAMYPFMRVPRLILERQGLGTLSCLTSAFLHANWSHLLGNMFFLWFFGRKVEDATGSLGFGLLYLLCGFTSSLLSVVAQAALSPLNAQIPHLGASGAIAGVMGAYLFLYSEQRVLTLVSSWTGPFLPLPNGCFIPLFIPIWLPAWVFLVFTFLKDALWGQLATELAKELGYGPMPAGVFSHLGGALGGLIFIYFFLHPEVLAQRR